MAKTYTLVFDDTAAGQRNVVRFLAQDNREGAMRLSDEEIDWLITQEENLYIAAATAAEHVAASFGPVSSKSVGSLSVSFGAPYYTALSKTLRARGLAYQSPTAGGLSIAEKLAAEQDTDRVAPTFKVKIHDHPETTNVDTSLQTLRSLWS